MIHGKKTQKQWEFKKRENGIDSLTNGCESSSSAEPIFKKHKSISNLKSPEAAEGHDIGSLQFERRPNKMKRRSSYEDGLKNKSSQCGPATTNIIRNFMETVLEELRVGREAMLVSMRKEVHKMMKDTAPMLTTTGVLKQNQIGTHHQSSIGSLANVQNCDHGSMVVPAKRRRDASCQTDDEVLEKEDGHSQTVGVLNRTEPGRGQGLRLSIRGPSLPANSNTTDSSTQFNYLTLPTVVPETCIENQRFNPLSCNSLGTRAVGNGTSMCAGKVNLAVDSSVQCGSFVGPPHEEKFRNTSQTGCSQYITSYISQDKMTALSNPGSGFLAPFYHSPDGSLKIHSQFPNFFDLGANGRTGSARVHGLTEFYVANDLFNIANSKTEDVLFQGNLTSRSQRESVIHELDVSRLNS